MSEPVRIAKKSDIPEGQGKKFDVQGRDIAVFRVDGKFYAIDDFCPHRGGPLSEGWVAGTVVTCPLHGWEFDVTTGKTPINPAAKVNCFQVKVEGDDVFILL